MLQEELYRTLQAFGRSIRPVIKSGADKKHRDQKNSYVQNNDDELVGKFRLSAGWHELGHTVRSSSGNNGIPSNLD